MRNFILSCVLIFSICSFIPGTASAQNTITITQAPSSSCDSGLYIIGFATTGNFNPNNLFFLELSAYGGSFTTPTVIDTLASTGGGNLFLQGNFPLMFSGNYRLRVRSSSPAQLSAPVDMAVTQLERPLIHVDNSIMVLLNAAPQHVYQWYRSGRPIGSPNATVINTGVFGRYFIQASVPGCQGRNVFSQVIPLNPSLDSLYIDRACVGEVRQWYVGISGGRFEPGNELRVEISDSAGNFGTNNSILGRSVGITYPSSLSISFPDTLVAGTGYRLRLNATNPIYISPPTAAFTLRARPTKPTVYRSGDTLFTDPAVSYRWKSIVNNLLPNSISSIYLPPVEGQYFVTIKDSFCTSLPSDTVSFFFTSNKELTQGLQIGPNPAQDVLRIMSSGENMLLNLLELVDVSGKRLAFTSRFINNQTLEISTADLPNGTYLLRYKKQTYKFMVKH